jgi:hypothetical protein
VSRARTAITRAVEARGYRVAELAWEPLQPAGEKEGIGGGWTLRVEPDPSPPGSSGLPWFGGLSCPELVSNVERFLPTISTTEGGG